jgi:hypothetical protein
LRARDNPFCTDRILRVRYKPEDTTWDEILTRLAQLGFRAAIVGPKGSGKTTLLEDLVPRLQRLGFVPRLFRLDEDHRRLPTAVERDLCRCMTQRDLVLLDGAEQMAWWWWWRFRQGCRRGGGLIITSHRPGLLPTLIECRPSPELLDQVVRELLGEAAPVLQVPSRRLYQECRGNVREVLRGLYDLCAEGNSVGQI